MNMKSLKNKIYNGYRIVIYNNDEEIVFDDVRENLVDKNLLISKVDMIFIRDNAFIINLC